MPILQSNININILNYRRAGFYHCGITANTATGGSVSPNIVEVIPFLIPFTESFDRIAIEVTTIASGDVRLGIYNNLPSSFPNNLILNAGTLDTNVLGIREIPISITLSQGLYWLARHHSATPALRFIHPSSLITLGTLNLNDHITGFAVTRPFIDNLPSVFPISGFINSLGFRPGVFLRKS